MKVLFDHQIFTLQKYGGISRYFCELMNQFTRDSSLDFTLALRYTQNENLQQFPSINQHWSGRNILNDCPQLTTGINNVVKKDIFHLFFNNLRFPLNQIESQKLLKKQHFDVFHPTYYHPFFLRYIKNKPYVVTVHDMIHELFPGDFPADDPTVTWKKQLVENAGSIIAISMSTKKDILQIYDTDPGKIHVIYHGNPFETIPDVSGCSLAPNPDATGLLYFLYVGVRTGYKNFLFFIESIAPLLQKDKKIHIICTGGGHFTQREMDIIIRLDVQRQVHYFPSDGVTIKELYKKAFAFIFPSKYEGFGLPLLESFSCGCPIIASNTSSIPEVAGVAALYFDPTDPQSLQESIQRLLSDRKLRTELIDQGYERLKFFSWQNTAKKTKEVYLDCL